MPNLSMVHLLYVPPPTYYAEQRQMCYQHYDRHIKAFATRCLRSLSASIRKYEFTRDCLQVFGLTHNTCWDVPIFR